MKKLVCLFLIVICWSCKQENLKKISADDIAHKELQQIDFSEVDQFPLFKTCDETANRLAQQTCFEQKLHSWLKPHLNNIPYKSKEVDTIKLSISVDTTGKIKLDSLTSNLELTQTFQAIFEKSPQIYPAQKRGIPVKVSFQLPVIIKVNQTL